MDTSTHSKAKTPLYEQTRLQIIELIQDGLKPGDLLPTQGELAKQLGASLITIKRAILELGRDGIIESVRGRGTVVQKTEAILDRRRGVSSWTESITRLGKTSQNTVLSLKQEMPEKAIQHHLGIGRREPVIHLERLRSIDDKPVCIMRNFLPASLLPGIVHEGLKGDSLYQCLRERYGIYPTNAYESLKARLANTAEQTLLGETTEVVLVIQRTTMDASNRIIEWAEVIASADSYIYETELHESNFTQKS